MYNRRKDPYPVPKKCGVPGQSPGDAEPELPHKTLRNHGRQAPDKRAAHSVQHSVLASCVQTSPRQTSLWSDTAHTLLVILEQGA